MTPSAKKTRYYDLDWLRIFSILAVFLYHSARAFDFGDWSIKNAQLSSTLDFWAGFLDLWIMPLLFFISGASIALSLRSRSAGQFARERVTRLLIPLIFGIFALASPQVYIERISRAQFSGSFIEFYPHYFDGLYMGTNTGNFAWHGLHLWYLLVLFVFSFLLLPLFLVLRRERVKARLAQWGRRWFENPIGLILLALPLMFLCCVLKPSGIGLRDFGGWTVFVYMVLVIYGFVMIDAFRFGATFFRYRWLIFGVGLVAGLATRQFDGSSYGTLNYIISQAGRALASWCLIMVLLGVFSAWRSKSSALLSHLSEMVMPFYMLHQTVIIVIGYYILQLDLAPGVKYGLIIVTCLPLIVALCEFVVMRVNALRFLFGLKPLPAAPLPTARPAHG